MALFYLFIAFSMETWYYSQDKHILLLKSQKFIDTTFILQQVLKFMSISLNAHIQAIGKARQMLVHKSGVKR